jgi:hypothetical protein
VEEIDPGVIEMIRELNMSSGKRWHSGRSLRKIRDSSRADIHSYVLDSACAFTKGLKKAISRECATACAKAGSQLVILTADGTIYWPIGDTTPASGQNERLLPFAGQKVTATGKVFQRGGSSALVIEKVELLFDQK